MSFRVDVSSPTANASGLVQVVNLSPPAPAPVPAAEPLVEPSAKSTATESSPGKTLATVPAAPVGIEKEENRATDNGSSAGSDAVPSVKSDTSPAKVTDKEPQPAIAERAASPAPVQEPTVRVWTEAVAGSPWGRLVGKVPLLRRLKKTAKITTPAPIFQAQPVLTDPAKDSITRPVSVKWTCGVDVAESGVVESAEVVEFSDPLNGALVNSALAAAVRWTFNAARSGEALS